MKYGLLLLLLVSITIFSGDEDSEILPLALVVRDVLDKVLLPYLISSHETNKEFKSRLEKQFFSSAECKLLALELLPDFKSSTRLKFDVLYAVSSPNTDYLGILRQTKNKVEVFMRDKLGSVVYQKKFEDNSCCAISVTSNGRYYIECIEKNDHYHIEVFDIWKQQSRRIGSIKKHGNQQLCQVNRPSMALNKQENKVAVKDPVQKEQVFTIHKEKTFIDLLSEQKFMHDEKISKPETLQELFRRMSISKELKNNE